MTTSSHGSATRRPNDFASAGSQALAPTPPTRGFTYTAWMLAAWCLGFAAVNLGFAATGGFADGQYAEYAGALAVMNWLAFVLKLAGAGIAILTVVEPPRWIPVGLRAVAVWSAFSLLAIYSAGSVGELVWFLANDPDTIDARGLAYMAFFAAGAIGYGSLAWSYHRRSGSTRRHVVIGALGGPVGLALLLVAAPAALGMGELL